MLRWENGMANGRREPSSSVGRWSGSTLGDSGDGDGELEGESSDADIDLEAHIDGNKLEKVVSADVGLERDKWERKVSSCYLSTNIS